MPHERLPREAGWRTVLHRAHGDAEGRDSIVELARDTGNAVMETKW
ncbi:MAG: hypothetical protein U0798_12000 [Gemmataceae bacterium]